MVCGPTRITAEGLHPVHNEALFIDMEPEDGKYEPLLGYLSLEQCGAVVDLSGPHDHRRMSRDAAECAR